MIKNISLAVISLIISVYIVHAQNDTLFIWSQGKTVKGYNINTEIDSIIFYAPSPPYYPSGTFADTRDGEVYKWLKIGNQIWMAENLKYLPNNVTANTGSNITPLYYVYGYNSTNVTSAKATANFINYGVLYNWPAACQSCPNGWHLPSETEWTELSDYLFGVFIAGGKLKEKGNTHWIFPNTGATDETGFSALPGGSRNEDGTFDFIGSIGSWWSSSESDAFLSRRVYIWNNYTQLNRNDNSKTMGLSVRCLKN